MQLTEIEIDGTKLRKLRVERRLSLKKVGEEIGVERGTVHNYEAGKADPSAKVLARICIYFGVPVENLTNYKNFSDPVS